MVNIYGREKAFIELDKWTSANRLDNKAIFGVKGVGKSELITEYFTSERLRDLAHGKNNTLQKGEITLSVPRIFVKVKLADWKNVGDLPNFLCDIVKTDAFSLLDGALDAEKKAKEILAQNDKTLLLKGYLELFKAKKYYFAFIFDDLNVISEDDTIGLMQYEYLRDLHDQGLACYLVTTDSCFTDSNVTLDFSTSFFCTKFTDRVTLKPLSCEGTKELLDHDIYEYPFSDDVVNVLYNVTSGFPGLLEVGKELIKEMEDEEEEITEDSLMEEMLHSYAAICYLSSWYKHLTYDWKLLAYQIAQAGKMYKKQNREKDEDVKSLGDKSGIGIVHIDKEADTKAVFWKINCKLFKEYILRQGEPQEEIAEICTGSSVKESEESQVPNELKDLIKETKGTVIINITNHNNIDNSVDNRVDNSVDNSTGKLVDNRSVNVISAGETVAALEDLSKLFSRNGILPLESEAKSKIGVLEQFLYAEPESEDEIIYNDDDDIDVTQNARTTEFTQGLCSSQQFARGELTREQKQAFWIPEAGESWFDKMSDSCKNQIICGINVYELLGNCITQFGLNMQDREHPRGILFALAFENHLKDWAGPAFQVLPVLRDRTVKEGNNYIPFKDATISKTTIGTYTKILEVRNVQNALANHSNNHLGKLEYNRDFWKAYHKVTNEIREYRNCCCHSGGSFRTEDLKALISLMFEQDGLKNTLLFQDLKG